MDGLGIEASWSNSFLSDPKEKHVFSLKKTLLLSEEPLSVEMVCQIRLKSSQSF